MIVGVAPERWQQIQPLFDHALELAPEDRAAWLDKSCEGDAGLRAQVTALVDAEEQAGQFLETPAGEYAAELFTEADDQEDPFECRQLGPYCIVRKIGSGGMGVVYEARDDRLERRVAIKLLPIEWSRDTAAKERFLREARAASTVDHPNICTVHDLGESEDGRLFIVMAYYEGESLAEKLARGPLPLVEAIDFAIQVARGLKRAHEAGITHRDIKPANVMVNDHGEAKILDFGIAKIADSTVLTRTGAAPGTPAYMSPEQATGGAVDGRSDIWSLGVMLYEMITGQRPFQGANSAAVTHAILHREPQPIDREGVNPALVQMVTKALAKDPAQRYQKVVQLLSDLESGTAPPVALSAASRRRRLLTAAAALSTALVVLALWWWTPREAKQPTEPTIQVIDQQTVQQSQASMAVLLFHNLTAEPELDWLRFGLADMLVTDLSQSPEIQVLGTDRLHQILKDLDALDNRAHSFDLVHEVAQRAGVEMVLLGSYARIDDVLRVSFKLEDAASGTILQSDSVVGEGQASLFSMADRLSASIRRHLELAAPAEKAPTMEEMTTSSVEAWRYYSEGINLHYQSKDREAITLLEKAVELDPGFAVALRSLGRLHNNLGHAALAREYTRRAIEHAERLPADQRYTIEGRFYAATWATYDRGIEAFREALRRYPEKKGLRVNLAELYAFLESYEEAIQEYETVIVGGTAFVPSYHSAASAYAARGDFETGYRLLTDLTQRNPRNWFAQLGLGWHLTQWGRLEEAVAPLRRATELRPGEVFVHNGWWRLQVLREDWPQAALHARQMVNLSDPYARWRGAICQARSLLYQGRTEEALEQLGQAEQAYSEPEAFTALSHAWAAEVLLEIGQADEALAHAMLAQEQGKDQWPELKGLFLAALAQQILGQPAQAQRLEQTLQRRAKRHANVVEQRQVLHLAGLLAHQRGEGTTSIEALRQAEALLPVRGIPFHWHALPDHVPIWYALATVELAAGNFKEAQGWFQRVAQSEVEHIEFPLPYIRSFYFLGRIHQQLGELEAARNHFERFLSFWQAGDLDRDRVQEAIAVLEGLNDNGSSFVHRAGTTDQPPNKESTLP